jgi:hypothetical protein
MATINSNSATNNANFVLWGWSTKIELRTDRPVGSSALHAAVSSIENLGVGITETNPFTNLS